MGKQVILFMNKNKIKSLNKKILLSSNVGLTLIEVMVAISVFSIVLLGSVGVMVTGVTTRHALKKQQQSVEDFSIAINLMAKRMRMSDITTTTGSNASVSMTDNIDGVTAYTYTFDSSNYTLKLGSDILANNVLGSFFVSATDPKFVTISIKMADDSSDKTRVQTTVSTRAYTEE